MKTVKKSFPVVGMSCAGCSARVDKTLNKQPGIISASVNLAAAMATVEYNPDECTPEQLKEAVRKIGFDLIIEEKKEVQKEAEEARKSHYKILKIKTLLAILLALPVSVIAMFFHDMPYASHIMAVLSAVVVFGLGNGWYILSFQSVQYVLSGLSSTSRNNSSCIFRSGIYDSSLYPFGTYIGG